MSSATLWLVLAAAAAVLGVVLVLGAFVALARLRILAFLFRALLGVVLLAGGAAIWLLTAGLGGVEALTRETVAARVKVRPAGPQLFDAAITFPDGRTANYLIAGDQVYLDAHVLKWKPIANWLGLHTSYRLDRIGGRYRDIHQEVTARRTVHPLHPPPAGGIDLVTWREQTPWATAWLLDAEYGSAAFVPVNGAADLELRVSTSGLLIRPAGLP